MSDNSDAKNETAQNDENESMEDKISWLRARGVTIDIPSERKAKPAIDEEAKGVPEHTFLYVKVPADTSQPLEQLQGTVHS